jgi:hypothetical protein
MTKTDKQKRVKMPAHNERFGVMAAEARNKGSAELKGSAPLER